MMHLVKVMAPLVDMMKLMLQMTPMAKAVLPEVGKVKLMAMNTTMRTKTCMGPRSRLQ